MKKSSDEDVSPSVDAVQERAGELLEGEFLRKAAEPGAEAEIDAELGEKLQAIAGKKGESYSRIRALGDQAAGLWAKRGKLDRKHMMYLGAALLYFISPLDALPDVIPALGYLDDIAVLSAVITMVANAMGKARDQVGQVREQIVEEVTDKLVSKGQVALNEVVDARADELFERFDRSAADAVDNTVTTVVVSIWAMTTAAAVSLAIATLSGGWTTTWAVYVLVSTGLVGLWNVAMAVDYLRAYRGLSGPWQQRLRKAVAAKLARRHLLALGLPVIVLVALGCARLILF